MWLAHVFTPSIEGISSIKKPFIDASDKEFLAYIEEYLKKTTYEISCPTVHNEKLSPPGCSSLTVGTLFDYTFTKRIKQRKIYEEFKKLAKKVILEVISEGLIENFNDHVVFTKMTTPLKIEQITGNDEGAITGFSHLCENTPAVTGFTAISRSVYTEYENIYQAGQWTFSPAGLPVSIITGKLAADKIAIDNK